MNTNPLEDYTGQGLLESAYSYEAPAYLIANGIVNGLIKAGWSERQAINFIHSKAYRWHFDFGMAKHLEQLGLEAGQGMAAEYKSPNFDYPLPEEVQAKLDERNEMAVAA